MRIFIDANVFIDIFDPGREYHEFSKKFYDYSLSRNFKLYTSCDLMTTIYYISRKLDRADRLKNIQIINSTVEIIEFSNKEIEKVCELMLNDSDYKDLEDTLQCVLAEKLECDFIVSNDKNFVSKTLKIFSSKQFCEIFLDVS